MNAQLLERTHGFVNYSIDIKNDVKKKKIIGVIFNDAKKNWTLAKAEQDLERRKQRGEEVYGVMRVIKIKPSTIVCIDIDEPVSYERVIEVFPILEGHCYVKGNTKGFHFYVKCAEYKRKQDELKCLKYLEGDIIINQMFELEGKTWNYDIQELDLCYIEDMMIHDAISETTNESVSETSETVSETVSETSEIRKIKCDSFHVAILDNINPSYYASYLDWCKFIWAIHFTFEDSLNIADKYSKLTSGYVSRDDVQKFMESATKEEIGFGYLMNLSKKSNLLNYKIAIMDKRALPTNEFDLAEGFLHLCDDIVKVGDVLYVYEKPYWVLDASKKQDAVSKKVMNVLRPFYKEYLQRTSNILATIEDDDEADKLTRKCKKLCKIIDDLGSLGMIHNIASMVRIHLPNSNDIFDNQPYFFCFKNCAFDLRTNSRVLISKEHYITQHTGYDYIPSSKEQIETLNKLIRSIFPQEEEYLCYMSILRTGCIGLAFEKFIMANGSGGNGKGLINTLNASMLGKDYYVKGNIESITSNMKAGPNAELASFHKKRCIRFSEISESANLNLGALKDITGGEDINARALYSNNTCTKLLNTTIFECNQKPSIDGRVDDAIIRRFINVPFRARFTNKKELLEIAGYYPANKYFKTDEFQQEYKCVLFDYLLQFEHLDIYEPECIIKDTYKYLCESDPFTSWMNANFEITENKEDIVSIKVITQMYKDGFLRNGTRAFKTHTVDKMKKLIDDNIIWKHNLALYFKDRIMINSKEYRSVFINIKIICQNDDQ